MATTCASPSRLVLGDKSTNASIRIHPHDETTKAKANILGDKPLIRGFARAVVNTPRAGQKRRFEELDREEHNIPQEASEQDLRRTENSDSDVDVPESQGTEELGEARSFTTSSNAQISSSGAASNSAISVFSSFHASQEPPPSMEEQFELVQEDSSQTTLEKIHATPIPEQLSQLLPPLERPALVTELSQDSMGMSRYIDFDVADEKDREKADEEMKEVSPPQPPTSQTPEDLRKELLVEKAIALRTRLQLAMHKIETRQVSRPFSRLQRPLLPSPDLRLPSTVCSSTLVPENQGRLARNSPESQIALHRARAFNGAYQSRAVRQLSGLPIPKIVPTEYSAKYVALPQLGQQRTREDQEFPSSPPPAEGRTDGIDSVSLSRAATPRGTAENWARTLLPNTPGHQQLGSRPGSADGADPMLVSQRRIRTAGMNTAALTSSVVKGEAANGLLELMRAASTGVGSTGIYSI